MRWWCRAQNEEKIEAYRNCQKAEQNSVGDLNVDEDSTGRDLRKRVV